MTRYEIAAALMTLALTLTLAHFWAEKVEAGDSLGRRVAACAGRRPTEAAWNACLEKIRSEADR